MKIRKTETEHKNQSTCNTNSYNKQMSHHVLQIHNNVPLRQRRPSHWEVVQSVVQRREILVKTTTIKPL